MGIGNGRITTSESCGNIHIDILSTDTQYAQYATNKVLRVESTMRSL